jgi:hypothetical protein
MGLSSKIRLHDVRRGPLATQRDSEAIYARISAIQRRLNKVMAL